MTGVVGGTVPAKLWKKFMTAALSREGLLRPAPAQRSPVDAVGDLVGDAVGSLIAPDGRGTFGEPDTGNPPPDPSDPSDPSDPPDPPESPPPGPNP
jgi:penicillin-binding protein 1A